LGELQCDLRFGVACRERAVIAQCQVL